MKERKRVGEMLRLTSQPIAIGYLNEPPKGVEKYSGGEVPSGCSFWLKAREGAAFYTVQSDHYNCAVGAYTHNIPLSEARSRELGDTIAFMVEKKYILADEVPGIPTLSESPRFVAYGPVDDVPFEPSVVIVAARPSQGMLIYEAALRAGVASTIPSVLGRPGCAIEPFTKNSGEVSFSFGCMGNRSYTGLRDEEMYVGIPGDKWPAVAEALEEIVDANTEMASYYTDQTLKFD